MATVRLRPRVTVSVLIGLALAVWPAIAHAAMPANGDLPSSLTLAPDADGLAASRLHTEVHTYFVAGEHGAPAVWVHNMCVDAMWREHAAARRAAGRAFKTRDEFRETMGRWRAREGYQGTSHGNSAGASGPHDVYAVRRLNAGAKPGERAGEVLHFGETGRGYMTRFAEHVRDFRERGIEIYVDHLATVEGKEAARALERRYITTYTRVFGRRPEHNPVNH